MSQQETKFKSDKSLSNFSLSPIDFNIRDFYINMDIHFFNENLVHDTNKDDQIYTDIKKLSGNRNQLWFCNYFYYLLEGFAG